MKRSQTIVKLSTLDWKIDKKGGNKKLNPHQLYDNNMDRIVKFVIGFIIIGTALHFVINDDPLNFDWAFECKKTLATVGC